MKVIARGRRTGKTTEIIKAADGMNGYIVCLSKKECSRIFKVARDMGASIRFPISFDEFVGGRYHAPGCEVFHIDNADILLQRLAGSVRIASVTLSNEPDDQTDSERRG